MSKAFDVFMTTSNFSCQPDFDAEDMKDAFNAGLLAAAEIVGSEHHVGGNVFEHLAAVLRQAAEE